MQRDWLPCWPKQTLKRNEAASSQHHLATQLHTARPALCVGHGQPGGAHAGGRGQPFAVGGRLRHFYLHAGLVELCAQRRHAHRARENLQHWREKHRPGAIDDARPDRWGERIIRHIDWPARLSILEMLLFAGDDHFGALGVSQSDMELLAASIDRDALRSQRQAFL